MDDARRRIGGFWVFTSEVPVMFLVGFDPVSPRDLQYYEQVAFRVSYSWSRDQL
jgi:hypothetical protein